jgi:AraC family transcriptional regulator
MSHSADAGLSTTRVPVASNHSFDVEGLIKLVEAACASLDSDCQRAKGCMQRAAEMLQSFREERRTAATAFSSVRGGLTAWQKQRVVAYVEANIGSRIRAADLARVVRLSKGHFFRAFRKSFGEPPMTYVVKRRVVHSQELICKSRAPLSEIALACGMCDQPHFTRIFHRVVGVSPGQWRREFAGGPAILPAVRADAVGRGHSVN